MASFVNVLRLWPLYLLASLLLVAWVVLYQMDAEMRAMADMAMAMPENAQWTFNDWRSVVLAWSLMMAAMMLPASWPLLRLLQRYGNTLLLALLLGYLTMWALFSMAASALQWALHNSLYFDPLTQRLHAQIGAGLMLAAAAYQLSPLKYACLRYCQSPFTLLMTQWRPGFSGALRLGLHHGVYCIACCWMLMLVLFALGAMNVWWAALLTLAGIAERNLPAPWPARVIALLLVFGALALIALA